MLREIESRTSDTWIVSIKLKSNLFKVSTRFLYNNSDATSILYISINTTT